MIKEERIKKNLDLISFPRLSGTDLEKRAYDIIKDKIQKRDLKTKEQKFIFSSFYSRVYSKQSFFLSTALLLIFYLSLDIIIALLIIIFYIPFVIYTRKPEKINIGKRFPSQNLFTVLKNKGSIKNGIQNKNKNILLFAHIDSKGQNLSIKLRSNSLKTWLYSLIISFIFVFIRDLIFTDFYLILTVIGAFPLGLCIISTFLLLINFTNNKSPGAIDNGSGLVIILEILNHLKEINYIPENYNIWFVFTGAEECGTMGIRYFYNAYLKDLDRYNTVIMNFDAIAKNLVIWGIFRKEDPKADAYNIFFEKTKSLDPHLILKNQWIRYTRSDGYYLKAKNFRGLGFGDLVAYQHIHSVEDTPDKVDIKLIKNLCQYLTELIIKIDKNY